MVISFAGGVVVSNRDGDGAAAQSPRRRSRHLSCVEPRTSHASTTHLHLHHVSDQEHGISFGYAPVSRFRPSETLWELVTCATHVYGGVVWRTWTPERQTSQQCLTFRSCPLSAHSVSDSCTSQVWLTALLPLPIVPPQIEDGQLYQCHRAIDMVPHHSGVRDHPVISKAYIPVKTILIMPDLHPVTGQLLPRPMSNASCV